MLKLLSITLLMTLSLHAQISIGQFASEMLAMQKRYTSNDKKEVAEIKESKVYKPTSDLRLKKYFNKKSCDKILNNNGYFKTCYDYSLKSALYVYIELDGTKVYEKEIEKRPSFYIDKHIPAKYRTKYSDYTKKGYDRGHSGANDASNDYSDKSLKATYVMSQIVPQLPKTNRYSYLKVEKYERKIANKLGSLKALTINEFDKFPKRIGRSKLAVPSGFYKIYWNKKANFEKCFYIPNDNKIYKLKEMVIDCSQEGQ